MTSDVVQLPDDEYDDDHGAPCAGMRHTHRTASECVLVRRVPPQFTVGQGERKRENNKNDTI